MASTRGAEKAGCEPGQRGTIVSLFRTRCSNRELKLEDNIVVRDSNGTVLAGGDAVHVIKDLKVKGTSVTLKRGTVVRNIRLTDDPELIECNAEKVKGLVLRTEFLKKA